MTRPLLRNSILCLALALALAWGFMVAKHDAALDPSFRLASIPGPGRTACVSHRSGGSRGRRAVAGAGARRADAPARAPWTQPVLVTLAATLALALYPVFLGLALAGVLIAFALLAGPLGFA